VITAALLIGDALALMLAFGLAYVIRFELLPYYATYSLREYELLIGGVIPAWLFVFALSQLYNPYHLFGGTQEYARVFSAVTAGTIILIIVGFLLRDSFTISRGWLILSWLLALILVGASRFCFRRIVYALRRRGHLLSPALIVGSNEEGRALAGQLRGRAGSGLYLVGFVDGGAPVGHEVCDGFRVIGDVDGLGRVVLDNRIEELIVAPTAVSREQLLDLFRTFGADGQVNLRLSSGLFEIMTTGLQIKQLAHVPLISVSRARITGIDAALKVALDYAVTIPGLILLSPLLTAIALAISLDSPGPVIYRRRVMGVGGEEFAAYKFRTMAADGDGILASHPELEAELRNDHKLKDDPRITRVGKLLRRHSLDELPQLFNVLRRQMSLVGPRMISPAEMAEYGKWGMNLLTVKPGMTGMWQVSGRSDVSYRERVRLDMHYIRNWSIWLDLQLLLRTIPIVINGRGAY
jgi:exopolysaccharide biosynthesis polyprenyl glycosylphosphotransferase